jgi:ATP:ADP antiporter, AAA family
VRQAIESLGHLATAQHVPWLIARLGDRDYRRAARQALAECGEVAVPYLREDLLDEKVDLARRLAVARVLGRDTPPGRSRFALGTTRSGGAMLDLPLIKLLSKLRGAGLSFARNEVETHLEKAMEAYFDALQVQVVYGDGDEVAKMRLLRRVLDEKRQEMLERIFRLLGLLYDPDDMYRAYLGLVSREASQRASALEFIDNVLERTTKERLIPLLDYISLEVAVKQGRSLFQRQIDSRSNALEFLLGERDDWLRACAAFSAGAEAPETPAAAARRSPREMVREAAAVALSGRH